MQYLRGFTGCALLLVLALMVAWPAGDAAAQAAKEVVVGYTGPISGVAAEYGQDCVNGVEMAVNDPSVGHIIRVNILGLERPQLQELARRRRDLGRRRGGQAPGE